MKKLIAIFSLFASITFTAITANAQDIRDTSLNTIVDSSTLNVSITLKAKQHFFLIGLMDGFSTDLRKSNYVGQVVKFSALTYDTARLITVTVPAGLVADLYLDMGTRQERLTAVINNEIKDALKPQLIVSPIGFWVLKQVLAIDGRNAQLIEQVINKGFKFVSQFKQ